MYIIECCIDTSDWYVSSHNRKGQTREEAILEAKSAAARQERIGIRYRVRQEEVIYDSGEDKG